MTRTPPDPRPRALLATLLLFVLMAPALAQKEYIVQTVPYDIADSWIVEIELSPGFLTEVNFPAPIRNPGSGDFGVFELIGKAGDQKVWLRPLEPFTATDLWVPMEDGSTAIFYVTYDDTVLIARKYVPADTVTTRQIVGAGALPVREPTEALPSWIHFSFDATFQGDDLVVAYSLRNHGLHPLANDRQRLRILANGNPLEFFLESEGRRNRLGTGESEDGTIVVRDLPPSVTELALEWVLVAQGVGRLYRIYEPLVPR